jgi:hypothetical protein
MKTDTKDQEKYQKDLEKTSKQIDGVSEYRDILSRVIMKGRKFLNQNQSNRASAIIAGLEIGFSYFCYVHFNYLLTGKVGENTIFKPLVLYISRFYTGSSWKISSFTEQTSVLTLPVLNGQRKNIVVANLGSDIG